jgi:hypothetical protein
MRLPVVSLVVGTIFWFAGCAVSPDHEYQLSPGRAYTTEMRSALLVSLNQTEDVPGGLEKGEAATEQAIVSYLEARGLELERVEVDAYRGIAATAMRRARRAAMSGTGGTASETIRYSDLIPHLVQELAPTVDLVVVPNMTIRIGQYGGGKSLRWDGVRRRTPGVGSMTMTGTSTAASLYVAIFDTEGTRLFSGYGGLDVLFAINRQTERMDLIPDRLEDLDNIREGVCIAFHPFFGDDPCP